MSSQCPANYNGCTGRIQSCRCKRVHRPSPISTVPPRTASPASEPPCEEVRSRERGQNLVEYALLGGLIALALLGVFLLEFQDALTGMINGIAECIDFDSGTDCAI
jgi:Flp pilus assembly pilin Flp